MHPKKFLAKKLFCQLLASYSPFKQDDNPLMVAALYLVVEILVPGLELLVVQRLHVEVGPLQLLLEHVDLVHSATHITASQYRQSV
jgi:hypothetical protein